VTVHLNQPDALDPVRPASLHIREYISSNSRLAVFSEASGITWSSWGASSAHGTGQARVERVTIEPDPAPRVIEEATLPVEVIASRLERCGGFTVYAALEVRPLAGVQPPQYFSLVQEDNQVYRCAVHASYYFLGEPEEKRLPRGECLYSGLHHFDLRTQKELGIVQPDSYCAMHWKGWGTNSATGVGIAVIGHRMFGARVRLQRIRFCPGFSVGYSRETSELWGPGEPYDGSDKVPLGKVPRLEALIGRKGQLHLKVHESMALPSHCYS
jgi:hypothetical protein